MNRDRMRLLLTPLRNGRSMPLILSFAGSRIFLHNNIDSILKFQSNTYFHHIEDIGLKDNIVIMKKALNKILIGLS